MCREVKIEPDIFAQTCGELSAALGVPVVMLGEHEYDAPEYCLCHVDIEATADSAGAAWRKCDDFMNGGIIDYVITRKSE